jgi:hypothetical protein
MIDGVLPRSRDLSALPLIASNCALADNDAETNIGWEATGTAVPAPLPASNALPKA